MQSDSVENIFARAWSLLTKNPVIIVPGLVVGIVVGIIQALIAPHQQVVDASGDTVAAVAGAGRVVASATISAIVGVLAFLVTETYTTGMAGAAWQTGITSLADGRASFREDAGRLLAAVLLIAVVGIVAAVLTLGLGWLVVLFFSIYVVPAVVLDNYSAVPAFRLSASIAMKRALPTIIIIVLLFVIGLVLGLVLLPLAFIPFLGPLVTAIVSQAVTAYATLVIVGEYLNARRSPDIIAAGPPPR
ncbi:MAG: hypothetical protein ABSB70_00980 [Candidatus Velthaea sp.]